MCGFIISKKMTKIVILGYRVCFSGLIVSKLTLKSDDARHSFQPKHVATLWRHGVVFRFWAAVPVFPPRFSPNSHQAWMIQRAIVSTQKNVKTKLHHMCVFIIIAFIEYIIDDTWWIQRQFHLMTQHNVHLNKAECETTGISSNSIHANLGCE